MKAKILWIEGKRPVSPSFIPNLRKKEFVLEIVSTGTAALELLAKDTMDLIIINTASLRTTGKRICRDLHNQAPDTPILVITGPEPTQPADFCANTVLILPFTTRKLLNRITPLLPIDEAHMLRSGPLRLDVEHRKESCQGRENQLTPRLTRLLQILMQHHDQVVKREDLFREAWNTEYTGDTRTLDVHISWLRQAIEEDPRQPHFLKTIRGVGYRLDSK